MQIVINIVISFCIYVGTAILTIFISKFIFRCWDLMWWCMYIRKPGIYPPAYYDSDGEVSKE